MKGQQCSFYWVPASWPHTEQRNPEWPVKSTDELCQGPTLESSNFLLKLIVYFDGRKKQPFLPRRKLTMRCRRLEAVPRRGPQQARAYRHLCSSPPASPSRHCSVSSLFSRPFLSILYLPALQNLVKYNTSQNEFDRTLPGIHRCSQPLLSKMVPWSNTSGK